MLMPDKLDLHNVMPVTMFAIAARMLTDPSARPMAAAAGNQIGHHALFTTPAPEEATRIACQPRVFYDAIARSVTPAGDLYARIGGLFICVWREDALDVTGKTMGASSLGLMLSRNELGQFTFDIARSWRVDGKPDDEASAIYTGPPEREGAAIGTLVVDALRGKAPHRALETNPNYTVRPAGIVRN